MTLPLLLSVPHAGLRVPALVEDICILTPQQVAHDGDEGAAEIYDLASEVAVYVSTDIARAIVDLNRAEDDRRKDGVIKTHTCWDEPVYRESPTRDQVEALLSRYYRPYHERLAEIGTGDTARLAVDCHTMAAFGPPVGPDPGEERPWVCLSNADGTCPDDWMAALRQHFERVFGSRVSVNEPFRGGYITRTHAAEMPWVQLELSRAPFWSNDRKRRGVMAALRAWAEDDSFHRGTTV